MCNIEIPYGFSKLLTIISNINSTICNLIRSEYRAMKLADCITPRQNQHNSCRKKKKKIGKLESEDVTCIKTIYGKYTVSIFSCLFYKKKKKIQRKSILINKLN